jgi:hypothetical protein
MSSHHPLDCLTEYLRGQGPGRLQDTAELERHLAGSWSVFDGNDSEGMTPEKLLGRMEQLEWSPPVLTFRIERLLERSRWRHVGRCLFAKPG